jgi:transcriptional regulator with XRE-family HTH domain
VESRKPESLADYVRRIRQAKGLSTTDVERQSRQGGLKGISDAYVTRIENEYVTNVSTDKLRALAKGLGVSEDEIFAVARGKSLAAPEVFDSEIYVMFRGFDELSDEDKADLLSTIRMLAAEVQRRRPKGGEKSGGKSAPQSR